MPTPLRILAATTLATLAAAQGPYYVNGLLGVDAPTHGTSPATPWKTISYAMANVPPQTQTTSEVIYVEGNQVYSPTTNGETFPITPAYNVWLEGTFLYHGNQPVLQIPPGGTGFHFPPNQYFFRNEVTYRYLVLDGGSYGMRMGSGPGFRHRPRIQDCTFRNQTTAAVSILNLGSSGDDPRFFQSTFQGLGSTVGIGIEAIARGNGCVVAPDVDECTFRDYAVALSTSVEHLAVTGIAGGSFRSSQAERCGIGVRIESSGNNVRADVDVHHGRFADCGRGVYLVPSKWTYAPGSPDQVDVQQSVFLRCGAGVEQWSAMNLGPTRIDIAWSTFVDCTKGLRTQNNTNCVVHLQVEDSLFRTCATGIDIEQRYDTSYCAADVRRCRLLGCGEGLRCWLDTWGARLRVESTQICGSTGIALWFWGFGQVPSPGTSNVELHGLTLADNGVGLSIPEAGPLSFGSHLVLAGNTTDLAIPATFSIAHSCLQGTSRAGAGNLNLTDPLLVRPFYKLSPGSPCIDAGVVAANLPANDYEGDPRASVSQLGGNAVPDLGADEYVFAGSARPYGTAGFGAFNVFPRIGASSPNAPIGGVVTVQLTGAIMPTFQIPANWALLGVSWREDSGSLPFDLAAYGLPGSYLWNDFAAVFPLQPVAGDGSAAVGQALPNAPTLVGLVLTHQWLALMPFPYGFVTSDALRVTIGR
jgi:hypothetical protein